MHITNRDQDISEILIDQEQLQARIRELAEELKKEYQDKTPILICTLKGATFFFIDLCRQLDFQINLEFIAVSSYGASTKSSGVVRIVKDIDTSITDRHVLLVEDIVDSGLTLHHLCDLLSSRKPASLKTITLLDKPGRRKVEFTPDYCGFEIPDRFVVGYGLDYAEYYRNLPYIGVLKPEVYQD